MMNTILYKYYVFLDTINSVIENNLNKIKNINIIVNLNYNNKESLEKELYIINFAKKNKIPFILKNNYQKCLQNKSDGILIDSSNKKIIKPILLKKKFMIIGIAHNQLEYLQKKAQGCTLVMLSPLFYNEKYSINKILNVMKFNNKKINWDIDVCALGGITPKNIKKIKLLNITKIGFKRFILEAK
jgi:thiamine-phosphate pyrophosphorylase